MIEFDGSKIQDIHYSPMRTCTLVPDAQFNGDFMRRHLRVTGCLGSLHQAANIAYHPFDGVEVEVL
jgi:hypothetical protein